MEEAQIHRASSTRPLPPNLYSHNPVIEAQVRRLLPIGALLSDPAVQEISINSGGRVYVDRGGRAMEITTIEVPENNLHVVIRLLKAADGGYLDPEAPFATLTLSCGGRFHGALQPAAAGRNVVHRLARGRADIRRQVF
jgi:Flp pilus assembly CpaF family ATPase